LKTKDLKNIRFFVDRWGRGWYNRGMKNETPTLGYALICEEIHLKLDSDELPLFDTEAQAVAYAEGFKACFLAMVGSDYHEGGEEFTYSVLPVIPDSFAPEDFRFFA
jgi:hypothetical protein